MSAQNESKGPTILFLVVWWVLAHEARYEDHDFLYALLLMVIGWLAIRMAGNAVCRLGWRAWLLLLQVALWFGLYVWFMPEAWYLNALTLWGVGIPLLFTGAALRLVYEGFPQYERGLALILRGLCILFLIFGPFVWWDAFGGVRGGFWETSLQIIFAAISLTYGWKLAKPVPHGERDARFGSLEDYRVAGMSDDR
jgi:hypothetical protein